MNPMTVAPNNVGCLTVFGAVFAVAGVVAMVAGIRGQLNAETNAWVAIYVGGTFMLVGVAIVFSARWLAKQAREKAELVARHPSQPWRWRADWSASVIRDDTTGAATVGAWGFAIFWNVIAIPVGIGGAHKALTANSPVALIALIFPLIGICLLAYAVLLTMRRHKFGVSVFTPTVLPASPGADLAGTIDVPVRFAATEGVTLRLACVHRRMVGTGKNRRMVETVLWEQSQSARPTMAYRSNGQQIPVRIALPADVPVTRSEDPCDQDIWYLHATAALPGANYVARFELPVFSAASVAAVTGRGVVGAI